jgi:hypothetical protein
MACCTVAVDLCAVRYPPLATATYTCRRSQHKCPTLVSEATVAAPPTCAHSPALHCVHCGAAVLAVGRRTTRRVWEEEEKQALLAAVKTYGYTNKDGKFCVPWKEVRGWDCCTVVAAILKLYTLNALRT